VRSEVAGCRSSRCPVATAGAATAARSANQSVPSRLDGALILSFVVTRTSNTPTTPLQDN
jgi:hypothetical protein